jgi:hypothetical protein
MTRPSDQPRNPRRQAAGRESRRKRGPLTEAGRAALRAAALRNRPWLWATGPRTADGKAKVAANGRRRQRGAVSTNDARADLADVRQLLRRMAELRRSVTSA